MSEPLSDEELADLRDSLAATDPGPEDTETRLFATIDALLATVDALRKDKEYLALDKEYLALKESERWFTTTVSTLKAKLHESIDERDEYRTKLLDLAKALRERWGTNPAPQVRDFLDNAEKLLGKTGDWWEAKAP